MFSFPKYLTPVLGRNRAGVYFAGVCESGPWVCPLRPT